MSLVVNNSDLNASNLQIIQQHPQSNSLVLYDSESQQFHVKSLRTCFACGQTLPDDAKADEYIAPYVDSNYFRLLSFVHNNSNHDLKHDNEKNGRQTPFQSRDYDSTDYLSSRVFNQGYYEKFFRQKKQLGRGYRGSVFLCEHVLDNVVLGKYAIKKIPVGDNKEWMIRMLREVFMLEQMRHFNVIEYRHCWIEDAQLTNFGPPVPCLFLLMELANGGNLEEYINSKHINEPVSRTRKVSWSEKSKGKELQLTLPEIWSFFVDICSGLDHLHAHGIIHRDLKPSNLLLRFSSDNHPSSELPRVLISDFGESENLYRSDRISSIERTGCTGTLEFTAPELLKVDAHGKHYVEYSYSSDIWSLGMILYFLCFGRLPYSQVDDVDILKQEIFAFKANCINLNFQSEIESHSMPPEILQLIKVMLSPNPRDRPTAREILKMTTPLKEYLTNYRTRRVPRMRYLENPSEESVKSEAVKTKPPTRTQKTVGREKITNTFVMFFFMTIKLILFQVYKLPLPLGPLVVYDIFL